MFNKREISKKLARLSMEIEDINKLRWKTNDEKIDKLYHDKKKEYDFYKTLLKRY